MHRGLRPIKVLFVEDDVLISSLMADELHEHGFDVVDATSGEQALARLEAEPEIDILFTDINLPGDVDGRELACRARAQRPDLPVVYASGRFAASGIEGMVTRALFVPKPYRPSDICTLLARLAATAH